MMMTPAIYDPWCAHITTTRARARATYVYGVFGFCGNCIGCVRSARRRADIWEKANDANKSKRRIQHRVIQHGLCSDARMRICAITWIYICIANLLLSSILENQQQHRYNYTSGVYGVNPLCCNFIFCCHNHTKPHTKPDLYIRKHDNKKLKKNNEHTSIPSVYHDWYWVFVLYNALHFNWT